MGCATGTVKYLLFFANLVFALSGLALLIVGIVYVVDLGEVKDAIPSDFQNLELAPILTIVVGSVIFFVAFLGCCGAVRESTCLLTTFAVVLLSIFVIQIAIGVFAFLKVKDSDDFESSLTTNFKDLIRRYNSSTNPSNEVVDFIQAELKCCGADSYTDYTTSPPLSCCEQRNSSVPCVVFTDGCVEKFMDFLQDSVQVVGYVAIGTAAVEIVSAIFALCLASSIRNESRRRGYH